MKPRREMVLPYLYCRLYCSAPYSPNSRLNVCMVRVGMDESRLVSVRVRHSLDTETRWPEDKEATVSNSLVTLAP